MKYYLFLLLFCCLIKAKANDTFVLHGYVIDITNNQPISFCNIVIKGKPTQGGVTNYKGYFTLDVTLGDTLITSYVGYKTNYFIVSENKKTIIQLKKSIINLPEFTISPQKKSLNAKDIVKKVRENWTINHYQYNKLINTEIIFSPNYTAFKNGNKIYSYTCNNIKLIGMDKKLFLPIKDTIYRQQKGFIPESARQLSGGTPYFVTSFIFFKPPVNKKYHFELGTLDYYNNQEVYQIKFHRKEGGGICEGGGYYLISKSSFSLLYYEAVTKNCVGIDNKAENLIWKYALDKIFFNKKDNEKYSVNKIESKIDYIYNGEQYFYKSSLTVDRINEGININTQKIVPAINVFYHKPISTK